MARRTRDAGTKVSISVRLTPGKLAAAQKILGTATASETIEAALDMVVFRQELQACTREQFVRTIASRDPN